MHKSLFYISIICFLFFTGCVSAVNKAISEDNLNELKRLIEVEHQEINPKGETHALHFAVWARNLKIVKYLIAQGADVNDDSYGWYIPTPLHIASSVGDIEMVKYLISQGAQVNTFVYYDSHTSLPQGPQPIHVATRYHHIEVVAYLLSHGANINAKDHHGQTPLPIAVVGSDIKLVKYLVEHGADVSSKDRWGYTPLKTAKMRLFGGNNDIIEYFGSIGIKD